MRMCTTVELKGERVSDTKDQVQVRCRDGINVIEYFTYDEITSSLMSFAQISMCFIHLYSLIYISYIVFCDVLIFVCFIAFCVRIKVMMIGGSPTLRTLNSSLWESVMCQVQNIQMDLSKRHSTSKHDEPCPCTQQIPSS